MIIPKGTYIFRDVLEFPMTNSMEAEFPFTLSVYSNEYNVELTAECISICVSSIGSDGIGGLEYYVSSTVPDMSMVGYTFPFYCIVYASEPIMVDGKTIDGWNTVSFDNRMKTITLTLDTDVSNEFGSWFFANTKGIYFPLVKGLVIPEGKVSRITDAFGRVLWNAISAFGSNILAPKDTWYKSTQSKSYITEIELMNTYTPTGNEDEAWIADEDNTGGITGYRINKKVIIAGNGSGKIYANPKSNIVFQNFANVASINGLSLLDTSKATTMSSMFAYMNNIVELDLSSFNTSNVEDMNSMFLECKNLSTLDVSSFNTSKVDSMINMFSMCMELTALDLSNFDTSKVKYMTRMFYYTGKSGSFTLNIPYFNTSNVVGMNSMFWGCKVSTLDVSSFNTSKVIDMFSMFTHMSGLTSLDLTSFNTSNVSNMSQMFWNTPNLNIITVSRNKWVIRDDCNTNNMFNNCGTSNLTYI